jgi:hypothetical protein
MARRLITMIATLALVACGEDPVFTPSVPTTITQVGTANGTPGWLLDDALRVKVVDHRGEPLEDVEVAWQTSEDGAWLGAGTSTTNSEGIASIEFAPGWKLGAQKVRATAGAHSGEATVSVGTLTLDLVAGKVGPQCGIDPAGQVFCWEHSPSWWPGKEPSRKGPFARPIAVDAGHRYQDVVAQSVAAPFQFCGITLTNQMRCWALDYGEDALIVQPALEQATPVPFAALAAGDYGNSQISSLCALAVDGTAWCRGKNNFGELGDGTRISRDDFRPVLGDVKFHSLVAEGIGYCALDNDDHAWCWGGDYGEPVNAPMRMGGDIRYTSLGFSFGSSCGVEVMTTLLYCWGHTGMEGIEQGDPTPRIEPRLIPGGAALLDIVGGSGSDLGVFRYAGGEIGFAGDMIHDAGYHRFQRRPSTAPPYPGENWRPLPRFSRLINKGSSTWCGTHQGGATLCAYRIAAPSGVPTPE